MGGLALKRVFALTPGGLMGMPGNAVHAGDFFGRVTPHISGASDRVSYLQLQMIMKGTIT